MRVVGVDIGGTFTDFMLYDTESAAVHVHRCARRPTIPDGHGVEVPSKFPYRATQAGDRLLLIAPSGGGYGPASERDPAAIREHIADGVLSREQARELYGFEE
jgi:N-methylhydantoinase B/oxoprolinase/acetone carboxylase alpha subunit